ncbi:MAG: hypothetical protein CK529_13440 [Rhodospirillaceae bacterium]|nr:MAG: hypothetical protein CK529_13440 [Rhodospirillaceae bacterium]
MLKRRASLALALSVMAFNGATRAEDGGILVLGATGQLGIEIVKDLVEAGEKVKVLVRPTSNRDKLAGLDVTYAVGDILSDADMEKVFTSTPYRAVIDASGQPNGGDQTYYEKSQRVISKWAAAGKVGQIILHGATGAGDSAHMMIMENVPEYQRVSIASKGKAEDILKGSGVTYTIIRHLTLLPIETKESGRARLTTNQMAVGAVTRDGLARLTMGCLHNPACFNMTFHAVDDDVTLSGRYETMWTRYRTVLKPYVFEARDTPQRMD